MEILLTHGHLDHAGGAAAELAQHYGVPVIGPEKRGMSSGWSDYRRKAGCSAWRIANRCVRIAGSMEGDVVNVGMALQVLHCPGHTPGHGS